MRTTTAANCVLISLVLLLGCFCCLSLESKPQMVLSVAKDEGKAIFDGVSVYGQCLVQATYSFLYPTSFPPKNEAELKTLCRSQTDAFKCLKEKTKGTLPILRRGALAFVNTRTKHHRKVCTNTASEQSRRLVEATKCMVEKRFDAYRANDAELVQALSAIARQNYNDSAVELKQICCSFHFFKRAFTDLAAPDCMKHKSEIEEFAGQVVPQDLELVCDDDEKLSKVCPKLERIQFKRDPNFKPDDRVHASSLAIYLITTLGEPNTDPNFKI